LERIDDKTSAKPAGRLRNSNLVQAWLILLLAVCFGSALAAVQVQLSGKIAANKLHETLGQIPALIWGEDRAGQMPDPASVQITPGSVEIQKQGQASSYTLYRVAQSGRIAGWVIKADGQGYGDKLELLIGADADLDKITGLFVLEQKETPGLGNKISTPQWRNQFVGKSTAEPLRVVKGQGRGPATIDAITGATISSRSVTAIVNTAIASLKGRLDARGAVFTERSKP
jgi:H+/Na+-translocating ferredoxin:NAD+ oxidoreductase subunit G